MRDGGGLSDRSRQWPMSNEPGLRPQVASRSFFGLVSQLDWARRIPRPPIRLIKQFPIARKTIEEDGVKAIREGRANTRQHLVQTLLDVHYFSLFVRNLRPYPETVTMPRCKATGQ